MPKLKQPDQKPKPQTTLKDFLDTYDSISLYKATQSLEQAEFVHLFNAYIDTVRRRYEIDALDLVAKDGQRQAAAYASGYAKACEEFPKFLEGLRQTVLGQTAYENPRPEEE